MTSEEDEVLLVLLVQRGDIAAFEKLLTRLHKPLRHYVAGLAGESLSDDILQEVSLRIYRQVRLLREPKAFRAWVYRIATRIAFVHLKREKRWREVESDPQLMHPAESTVPYPLAEAACDILGFVDRVSPASRAVLLLHYQQQLSLEETAAILDIPVGTVKSRLSYGVAKLRELLKEKERR